MLILGLVGILLGNLLENLSPYINIFHTHFMFITCVLYIVQFPNYYTKVKSFTSFYTNIQTLSAEKNVPIYSINDLIRCHFYT